MPKYCDHGAYIPDAVFNGQVSSATLTVNSISSGAITLGMSLASLGMPDHIFVLSFGTGTGGTGTYTLNASPGTLTARSMTGRGGTFNLIPPAFGVPQDGDGVGKNASTASATVNIDLTGATAAAGATISIAGATLTCVASGAATTNFNAGTGATLAANIAAAINRTSSGAVMPALAAGWSAAVPMWATMYARVVGNVLQIMFRAGSASHNGQLVVTSGFAGGTFGPYTFSGGISGCWGLLGTWGPVPGGSVNNFGVLGSLGPTAGTFDAGDIVRVRCGKVVYTSNSAFTAGSSFAGNTTSDNPVVFVFDDGTTWADDPTDQFIIRGMSSSACVVAMRLPNAVFEAAAISDNEYKLKLIGHNSAGYLALDVSGGTHLSGVTMVPSDGNTAAALVFNPSVAAGTSRRAKLADFYIESPRNTQAVLTSSASISTVIEYGPGVISATGSASAHTGVLSFTGGMNIEATMRNVRFTGFVIGSRLHVNTAPNGNMRVSLVDCDLGNISQRGPYASSTATYELASYISAFSNRGQRDFSYDTPRGFCQWNSVYAQPTLNAKLDDGVTPWSIVVAPATAAGAAGPYCPFSTPRFSVISALPTGPRTFTVEFAVSDQVAWTRRDISISVAYVAADGSDVVLDSFDRDGGALTASTSTWSSEVGGKVSYVDGGTLLHNKYRLQLTTPPGKSLPDGGEVTAVVRVHATVSNASQYVIIDPEIQVA